jgi:hypothetical protein
MVFLGDFPTQHSKKPKVLQLTRAPELIAKASTA